MRVRSGAPGTPVAPTISTSPSPGLGRTRSFTAVLGERGAPAPAAPGTGATPRTALPRPPGAARRQPGAAADAAGSPSPVRALLAQTLAAEQRLDTLLAAAARGRTFSPAELLALQATAFRYAQVVEVVSRATDKLVGAVKQTMGTQV
jgi:hypothetical protein